MMKQYIEQLNDHIVRVSYTCQDAMPPQSELISDSFEKQAVVNKCVHETLSSVEFLYAGDTVLVQTGEELSEKEVSRYVIDGEPQIMKKQTANGEVSYIANATEKFERYSYMGELEFEIGADELLLGLGQYEDGIFDYRNHTEYLYESNMRIALPILMTTGHYAIFVDSQSNMIFKSEGRSIRFEIDTTEHLTYYVILGKDIAEIIRDIQELTGKAALLPRWAFGYIQSRERYRTSEEILGIADEFRKRDIPLDCIVQDWHSWKEGVWGEKKFDPARYPDVPALVQALHDRSSRLMISVWPNMNPECDDYQEFAEQNLLLENANVYNAFAEEAAALYWKQCETEIMSAGCDALWCDNAEPFSDADWYGETKRSEEQRYRLVVEESKKSIPWEKINSYGLYHARGIYHNWRRTVPNKRVVNLTRSSYVSGQQYGCITWSGDICARWEVMRTQIVEGLKMGLCGNPYWTLDIGGFFVVDDQYENRGCDSSGNSNPLWFWKGDYNAGVHDLGYRELYTRWLQLGVFLPIFRSHGTDTPREPWNFGETGEMFYDTIVKFIRLRYYFMPYIYSCAAAAHRDSYIIMRSLLFDFAEDQKAGSIVDEYMFGTAFLAAPVLQPMHYDKESRPIQDKSHVRKVYLPQGTRWFDYWTDQVYEGGSEIACNAPLEQMPLFVRAGSIIPVSEKISYADEKHGEVDVILIYQGADGKFTLYNDAGDGYDYQEGTYWSIEMEYHDHIRRLRMSNVSGKMEFQNHFKITFIKTSGVRESFHIKYFGKEISYLLA